MLSARISCPPSDHPRRLDAMYFTVPGIFWLMRKYVSSPREGAQMNKARNSVLLSRSLCRGVDGDELDAGNYLL